MAIDKTNKRGLARSIFLAVMLLPYLIVVLFYNSLALHDVIIMISIVLLGFMIFPLKKSRKTSDVLDDMTDEAEVLTDLADDLLD